MLGRIVSHYRVVEKLGAGGMGVVYKAVDLQLERTVALKFLPNEIAVSQTERAQLLQEARAASTLDHPNVGVIYGIEETADGHFFIVMAHYEGETLAQRLERLGSLPLDEALDFAMQIASGLSAAHARSIVHRDIKPSNVLITTGEVAKIVDFGLARIIASASATQTFVSGSLPYMAPEQILAEPVGPSCDIWALGIVMVQMIAGVHPFARESSTAMTFAILNQPPQGIDKAHPALQALLYRALSKDPVHRDATAREMLAALQTVRDQLATTLAATNGQSTRKAAAPLPRRSTSELKQSIERASMPRWSNTQSARPRSRRIQWAAVALCVFAAVIALLPATRQRIAGLWGGASSYHIAVLPFDNPGNNPENETVVQGLTDALAGKLSNLDVGNRSLWVIPTSEVRRRKITGPTEALQQLGATLVVKGSVQLNGKDVRLDVNLIDTKNLRQIGAAQLDNPSGDLATLQNEAVSRIARLMHLPVSAASLTKGGDSANPAAYQDYLKALGYMQRYDKPGNLDAAILALRRGIQTDPGFALGYAQLADAYRLKNQIAPDPNALDQALAYAGRAVQLDQSIAGAYVTLGRIHAGQGKTDLAAQEFQQTLKLNPTDAQALDGMARNYERSGRIADAEQAFQKAVALRPEDWDAHDELGGFYDRQGKYAQAIAAFQKAVALTPDNARARLNLGAAYTDSGDPRLFPLAENALKKSIQLDPSYPAYANLGNLYIAQRRYVDAAAATQKALAVNSSDYLVWGNLVTAYQWLHQEDKAATARMKMLPLVQQAIRSNPKDAMAQSTLATLYAQNKLNEKAQEHLATALALAPDDPSVLSNAADSFAAMGDRTQAMEYIRKALQKGFPLDQIKADPLLQGIVTDPGFTVQAAK